MSYMAEWEIDLVYDASVSESEAEEAGYGVLNKVGFDCDMATTWSETLVTFRGEGSIFGGRDFSECHDLLVKEVPVCSAKEGVTFKVSASRWRSIEPGDWDEEFDG